EVGGGGLAVLPLLAGTGKVILVDAMMSGAQAGVVRRYAAPDLVPLDGWRFSTHQLGLAEALQLGRQLQPETLPRELVVVGIEIPPPQRFHLGLSRAVAEAVPRAVEIILGDL
ncbi:MAG: hydrogenase maturation protease, partial [Firmicutes bacterium]|nr:hydrogenase maturation protease [Bacillota bacterium]